MSTAQLRNWDPFELAAPGAHADAPRSIHTLEGIGDRLRAAAFAEFQAREAFLWGAEHFTDAPEGLRQGWRELALAEDRHLNSLLARMKELGISIQGRKVSDHLWHSLVNCTSAREFAFYMSDAEERGRKAGDRFYEALSKTDPQTAKVFKVIADEEVEHIALPLKFYSTH
jgi:uncharacterized ferritin-like protein (DUF455 family)